MRDESYAILPELDGVEEFLDMLTELDKQWPLARTELDESFCLDNLTHCDQAKRKHVVYGDVVEVVELLYEVVVRHVVLYYVTFSLVRLPRISFSCPINFLGAWVINDK